MGQDVEQVKKKATLEGAKIVAKTLKDNVNRSTKELPGYKHLKDNVKVSSLKEDEELNEYRGVGFGKLQHKANWLEYGTSKMQGQHIMSKTIVDTRIGVKEAIDKELKKVLGK